MFNLLPDEDKNFYRLEYSRRFWSAALSILLFILISTVAVLAPALLKAYSNYDQVKYDLGVIKSKPAANDYRDMETKIQEVKILLDMLKSDIPARPHIEGVLSKALVDRPQGISITDISWYTDENQITKLVISGVASNRELLRNFVSKLGNNPAFSDVSIPVESYAKAEKADFSITLQIKMDKQ